MRICEQEMALTATIIIRSRRATQGQDQNQERDQGRESYSATRCKKMLVEDKVGACQEVHARWTLAAWPFGLSGCPAAQLTQCFTRKSNADHSLTTSCDHVPIARMKVWCRRDATGVSPEYNTPSLQAGSDADEDTCKVA